MTRTLSFADIQRLKKLAKQAAKTHPFLSHGKRLDLVAARDFELKNYHEARKFRARDILRHVESTDGEFVRCSFCGFHFHLLIEQKEHQQRHDAFEEAVGTIGYAPSSHVHREKSKAEAWKKTYQSDTTQGKAEGYVGVFRAWFDRSLDAAITAGYWKKHPSFDQFVSMIVGSEEMPIDVKQHLIGIYGRNDGHIEKGSSYWYPPR